MNEFPWKRQDFIDEIMDETKINSRMAAFLGIHPSVQNLGTKNCIFTSAAATLSLVKFPHQFLISNFDKVMMGSVCMGRATSCSLLEQCGNQPHQRSICTIQLISIISYQLMCLKEH